jgi:hypothetical protein
MQNIAILDRNLCQKTIISDFKSFTFSQSLNGKGAFELIISAHTKQAENIEVDDILNFSQYENGIIESIVLESDKDKAHENYVISGIELKDITKWRKTIPPAGLESWHYVSKTAEYIVRDLIDNFFVTCTQDLRNRINIFALGSQIGVSETIDYSSRLKPLDLQIHDLLVENGLGLRCDLDKTASKVYFEVYRGIDRTIDQSVNSRALFSLEQGTLIEMISTFSTASYQNVVYVAGQGMGIEREIIEVPADNATSGWDRRVGFIDARDAKSTDELAVRGNTKLAEFSIAYQVSGKAFVNQKIDYSLGDIVTIKDRRGNFQNIQIVNIKKTYSGPSPEDIELSFGEAPISISTAVNSRFKDIESFVNSDINQSSGGVGGGDVSSVFARTGAVTAQSGDYSASQVTSAFDKTADTIDSINDGTTFKKTHNDYSDVEKTKLAGVQTGAQVNNISDVNAADLTDGADTTLHDHEGISENTTHRTSDGKDHSDVTVNNAKVTNATHTGEVTGSSALTVADDVIDQANLKINAPTDDHIIVADSSDPNGWKWATPPGGDVSSVFARTGNVTAQSGDYSKSDVGLSNVDNTSDADKPVSTATQTGLDGKLGVSGKAADSDKLDGVDSSEFVKTSGAQTIADVKTFSSSPIVPTPTTDYQASTKKYVDDSIDEDSGWTAPSFENSWVNCPSSWDCTTAGYRKVGNQVFIKGFVQNGSVDATIFTLPAGYRPSKWHEFAIVSNGGFGLIGVGSDGSVYCDGSNDNNYLALDPISFFVN